MNSPYINQIREMLEAVEKFIYDDSIEVNQVASYIVGKVMFHDDYDEIITLHPDIGDFAEIMGSNREVLPEDFLREINAIEDMRKDFEALKAKYLPDSTTNHK